MTFGLTLGILFMTSNASVCTTTVTPGLDAEIESMILVAAGQAAAAAGREIEALACLDAAQSREETVLGQEERAFVLYRLGRHGEALEAIQRALELGDVDPEASLLESEILASLGRLDEAREAARRAGSWEGSLVGASLADASAAYDSVEHMAEQTERGALTALTLGARALEEGRLRAARGLLQRAAKSAELAAVPGVRAAVGELLGRARSVSAWRWAARLGSALDYATNPSFLAGGEPGREAGLRMALLAEGGVAADLGSARAMMTLRLDQHVFLGPRDIPADLDVFGLSLASALELPLSQDPSFVVLGLSTRFSDLSADRFKVHYAVGFEGGPYLRLRLGPSVWMSLAFSGVLTNFIDKNAPSDAARSLDRDRAGQRGLLGIRYAGDWLDVWVDGMFVRDDAIGDAFDGLGGGAAVRLEARPEEGLEVFAGVSLLAMEYGPVGDSAIIGPAATRTELRTVAEGGVRFPLLRHLDFIVKDTWINDAARTGHAYTENVLSMGLEAWW